MTTLQGADRDSLIVGTRDGTIRIFSFSEDGSAFRTKKLLDIPEKSKVCRLHAFESYKEKFLIAQDAKNNCWSYRWRGDDSENCVEPMEFEPAINANFNSKWETRIDRVRTSLTANSFANCCIGTYGHIFLDFYPEEQQRVHHLAHNLFPDKTWNISGVGTQKSEYIAVGRPDDFYIYSLENARQ